ncbi:MAG: ribonuclease HII [Simkaniaceae bacterium]|nr:ribonuclease HII [Simkaniaceae bacterium]
MLKEDTFNFARIAGVDEAGRGPLAGPVVAAACVIPKGRIIPGVDDSKRLTPSQRERLYSLLVSDPSIDFGIGIVEASRIDEINVLQATFEAMLIAVSRLKCTPDFLLIDGNRLPKTSIPAKAIVGGDGLYQSIAAASIIAKEARDILMKGYHLCYPDYGFDQHKGYGTEAHLQALKKGFCPQHRRSFKGVVDLAEQNRV